MLADVLDSLGTTVYVLVHRAPGGFDGKGRALPEVDTPGSTTGMMQPLSGERIERLKEGLHAVELRGYWSADQLVVADHENGTIGDHITTPDSNQWEVVKMEDWSAN